jgi:hypothetical protein
MQTERQTYGPLIHILAEEEVAHAANICTEMRKAFPLWLPMQMEAHGARKSP